MSVLLLFTSVRSTVFLFFIMFNTARRKHERSAQMGDQEESH